ncbi:hypothetical protein [Rhizobium sp.]|uniref:hypothetical protein n=1 Tax=Rhizobium sp. TaxID=391 RepID=UPI00289AE539
MKSADAGVIAGLLTSIAGLMAFAFTVAAWVTHVIACIKAGAWILLALGCIVAPVGVIHGFGLWLGAF